MKIGMIMEPMVAKKKKETKEPRSRRKSSSDSSNVPDLSFGKAAHGMTEMVDQPGYSILDGKSPAPKLSQSFR